MEYIIAKRIQALAEKHAMLPETYIGGRKLRSTEYRVHYILDRTFSAWSKGKVVTVLLLDIAGAFDKVLYRRLLHDLKRKEIPYKIVGWIGSFLTDRTTILKTAEYTSGITTIYIGIP